MVAPFYENFFQFPFKVRVLYYSYVSREFAIEFNHVEVCLLL